MTSSSPFTPDGPRMLLSELCRLTAERQASQREIAAGAAAREEAAEKQFLQSRTALVENYRAEKTALETEYVSRREETETKFRTEHAALEKKYAAVRTEIEARYTADQQAAGQALQDAHWEAIEASDAARGGLNVPLKELIAGLETRWGQLEEINLQAVELMRRRNHWDGLPPPEPTTVVLEKHPGRRFLRALEQAQTQYRDLARQRLPSVFQGLRPLGIFFLLWLLLSGPAIAVLGVMDWSWPLASCAVAGVIAVVGGAWLFRVAKRRSAAAYIALRQTMLEAGVGYPAALEAAVADCRRLDATIIARHKSQTQQADANFAAATAELEARRNRDTAAAESLYPRRMTELTAWHEQTLREIEEKYPAQLRRLDEKYQSESLQIQRRNTEAIEQSRLTQQRQWDEMAARWREGLERFRAAVERTSEECRERFPDWNGDDWQRWTSPAEIPAAVPLGLGRVNLAALDGGVPDDPRLKPDRLEFDLPLALPFPRHTLLMLKADGQGRAKAVELMQSVMLRMLSAMPPSKVRFTIIDPVGLGENFSAFMHLADYDEQLVASRIWTDSAHIEQRLADLTKHMENVIQVYLRKEYGSIEEYNASAGELSEPYRVLVVANFPANFNDAAVQRIKSIIASGARCGVFVILGVDASAPLPRTVRLADLEAEGLMLRWSEGRFEWKHPDYGPLALEFTPPPPVDRFKQIVCEVGAAARETGRVEVPFECIVPNDDNLWTFDSRAGLEVPLGRAGALKLQSLSLGGGTSQHVLISGKTGSGKSTLLHVLITNLALRYAPDEVELYLVDFKKGVEFKAYARAALPHARVVAIESEREFGLSVLERLDAELRDRGDLLRRLGLQDLKGYRAAKPDARLPRILLVIDEFQELFTEDDRISQESALLLDRLVRQGRAFGIHVLLGSQTLGGAYTLARSTIGQMAVRIALQCSEADAHLILSEDNTAARLLTRPGEAIYNDANGLYEGNHPFQIVWLPDGQRDEYLNKISQMAKRRNFVSPGQIVFEGNVLADLADNPELMTLLDADTWPPETTAAQAWLGAAVAIKEPTSLVLHRQNGSNMLMVGHREEAALGVLSACLLSLAAQHQPNVGRASSLSANVGEVANLSAKFIILDGMRADAPDVGFWKQLADALPHELHVAGVREAPEVLGELYAELSARQEAGNENAPPIYLFIYNFGRFRELRKEDDYGYSSDDGPAKSPPKQFAAILRDGPPLGIHAFVWCDTYANVTRLLDRKSMEDFEKRVLFQMNANDSSSLMDSPEAGKLGVHRAILYDDGQGVAEKFRPYGLPSAEFLTRFAQKLDKRKGKYAIDNAR